MERHAIIAGVNKCGTTSVYRYLARHPDVLASRIKETRFFVRNDMPDEARNYDNYLKNFAADQSTNQVLLEASPSYFTHGAAVAQKIRLVLSDVKLIVMLRDPVARLISYYRSALVYDNYANKFLQKTKFSEFVSEALDAIKSERPESSREIEFARAIDQGLYSKHLRQFGGEFRDDQVKYVFFEDFVADTRLVMNVICQFLEIDADYFREFEFSIENKTRTYRSPALQRIGYQLNMKLEPFFNARPRMRRLAQTVYRRINERRRTSEAEIDPYSVDKLKEFYCDDSRQLRKILLGRGHPGQLPGWLNADTE